MIKKILTITLLLLLILTSCQKEEPIKKSDLYIKLSNGTDIESNIEVKGITTQQQTSTTKYGNWANFKIDQEDNITIRYCFDDYRFYESKDLILSQKNPRIEKHYTCTKKANNVDILSREKIDEGKHNTTITIYPKDGLFEKLTICEEHTSSFTNVKLEELYQFCNDGWNNCKNSRAGYCKENYTIPNYDCNGMMMQCQKIVGKYCILTLPSNLPTSNCIRYNTNLQKDTSFSFKLSYDSYYPEQGDYIRIYAIDKEGRRFNETLKW